MLLLASKLRGKGKKQDEQEIMSKTYRRTPAYIKPSSKLVEFLFRTISVSVSFSVSFSLSPWLSLNEFQSSEGRAVDTETVQPCFSKGSYAAMFVGHINTLLFWNIVIHSRNYWAN